MTRSLPRTADAARPGAVLPTVAVVVGAAEVVAVVPVWSDSVLLGLANLLVTLSFVAVGVLLAGDPHQRGNAWLFVTAAATWTFADLGSWEVGPLPVVQYTVPPLGFAVLAQIVLRYPDPVLPDRASRVLVGLITVVPFGIRCGSVVVSTAPDHYYPPSVWWPTLAELPGAAALLRTAYPTASAVLVVCFVALALSRFRHSSGIDRRLRAPVAVAATAAAAIVLVEVLARFLPQYEDLSVVTVSVEVAMVLAIPVAFGVSGVRRRLARLAVADLVLELSGPVGMVGLRAALREAVSDADLEVTYWIPDRAEYVDPSGAHLPSDDPRYVVHVLDEDGGPLARLHTSPALRRYPELVDAAAAAARLGLGNTRLHAAVRAQLEEVRSSRARIVEAGDVERRRLERNLHDGAQQQLLGLRLRLVAARAVAGSERERTLVDEALDDLGAALEGLRELARGIHPTVLVRLGLGAAIRAVADRQGLTIDVDVPERRLAPTIEATAYFVACEALTNVVKHAAARTAAVVVTDAPDGSVTLRVVDDGVGGAVLAAGGGLTGLRDRVEAVGGSFAIVPATGGGTEVVAYLPTVPSEPVVGDGVAVSGASSSS